MSEQASAQELIISVLDIDLLNLSCDVSIELLIISLRVILFVGLCVLNHIKGYVIDWIELIVAMDFVINMRSDRIEELILW